MWKLIRQSLKWIVEIPVKPLSKSGIVISIVLLGIAMSLLDPCFFDHLAGDPEARTRSRCGATQSTFREISFLLEDYHSSHQSYPPGKLYSGRITPEILKEFGVDLNSEMGYRKYELRDRYNWSPQNPIKPDQFQYYTDGKRFWALYAPGPDGNAEITSVTLAGVAARLANEKTTGSLSTHFVDLTYDPSNGTLSHGDLWRTSVK